MKTSSDRPPEFFFDRSLGKRTAALLVEAGWTIHLIADHYPDDAANISDAEWISEGCGRGWVLLTKDQRIRYRAHELASLTGQLFCLASGNLTFEQMAERFVAGRDAMLRITATEEAGFWLVYDDGRIEKRWPVE